MDDAPVTVSEVAKALQAGNVGLTIASNVIEYPTRSAAEAARREFRRVEITAIQLARAPQRLSVVYGAILTNVIARVIVVTEGRVVPKKSAVERSA